MANRSLSPQNQASTADLIGQVYVVAEPDTNSLLVSTSSTNFERVKSIIADLDRAVPQVLIKVLIAEVTHQDSLDLGVEFSGMNLDGTHGFKVGPDFAIAGSVAANHTALIPNGFVATLNETNVTAAINALATTTKLDVLSRPYILTSDNQEAQVMVGQSVPFVTGTETFDTGAVNNTVQYDNIGIILDVTPHINPAGLVTMDIYPQTSSLAAQTVPIGGGINAPVFNMRYAQARVAVRDGQTIVIGGLMQDQLSKTVNKVPFLGDIPCLGVLFQSTTETKTKTELLIFITPHVALQPDELQDMSKQEKAGLKIVPKAVEPGLFDEHMKGLERGASTRPAIPDVSVIEVVPTTQPTEPQPADPTTNGNGPGDNAPNGNGPGSNGPNGNVPNGSVRGGQPLVPRPLAS
jgi:general secretion pathway protein D